MNYQLRNGSFQLIPFKFMNVAAFFQYHHNNRFAKENSVLTKILARDKFEMAWMLFKETYDFTICVMWAWYRYVCALYKGLTHFFI